MVSFGKRPRGLTEEDETVTRVCEQSVKGVVGEFEWDEMGAYFLRRRDRGGFDR